MTFNRRMLWSNCKSITKDDTFFPNTTNGEIPIIFGQNGETAYVNILGKDISESVICMGNIENGVYDFVKSVIASYTEKYVSKNVKLWITDGCKNNESLWRQCPLVDAYFNKEDCVIDRLFNKLRKEYQRRKEIVGKYGSIDSWNITNPTEYLSDIVAVYLDVNNILSCYTNREMITALNELLCIMNNGSNLGIHIIMTGGYDVITIPVYIREAFKYKLYFERKEYGIATLYDGDSQMRVEVPTIDDDELLNVFKNNI